MRSITASSDSTAPDGLPGRFRIRASPRTPHTARLKAANFVDFEPSARIRSAIPSSRRSQTARVASGVTSRFAIPVPPVVTTKRACPLNRTRMSRIARSSSGTISRATTLKFFFSRASATAGPPRSARSPRKEESLTVTTAAVRSGVEEDIFFLGFFSVVAVAFIEQAQAFHQQALRVQLCSGLRRFALEIQLEVSAGPSQNLEHRLVTLQAPIRRVNDLALGKVHIALLVIPGQRQQAALAAHLQRLHQVDDVHLRQASAQHAIGRHGLRHLLQRNLVDHTLDAAGRLFQEERLLYEVIYGVLLREALGDIGLGSQNDRREVCGRRPAAQFFNELAPIHARHAVVGYE